MRNLDDDYRKIYDEFLKIEKFRKVTLLSYGLSHKLLEESKEENLIEKYMELLNQNTEISYCQGDAHVNSAELICEWISEEEYAERYKLPLENIKEKRLSGKLGHTITKDNVSYVIWPKEQQAETSKILPKLGEKKYNVKIDHQVSRNISMNGEVDGFLALMGKEEDTIDILENKAKNLLNENCFLLGWSAFELYVKDIIYTLYHMKPESFFNEKQNSKEGVTYNDIYQLSDAFRDIEKLRESIIERIISKSEENEKGIHGSINLIKDKYLKGKDPYDTWYIYNGNKKRTNYMQLMDIKSIRNSLVHDRGNINPERWKKIGEFKPEKQGKNTLLITDQFYEESMLALKAISFNLRNLLRHI